MRDRRTVEIITVAVLAVALPSVLAIAEPVLRLAVASPAAGAVAAGACGMAALLAAALCAQRFRGTSVRLDPRVAAGLAVMLLVAVRAAAGEAGHEGAALDIAACALLAVAAFVAARQQRACRDELLPWLSAAFVLGALGRLEQVVMPVGTQAVFTWPDFLALAATAALLAGVLQAVAGDQRRFAEAAVADERRRIARELHDGLAQEVAFIAANARYLAERPSPERAELMAGAAQRALEDSRGIIGALRRRSSLPLGASLAVQAEECARRWGLSVELDVQEDVDVSPEHEHAILRIVGEALSNAARHAEASTVNIRLGDRDGRLHVSVRDDGRGFDPAGGRVTAGGFGLQGMRERAESLGGELELESRPGWGTRVELALS